MISRPPLVLTAVFVGVVVAVGVMAVVPMISSDTDPSTATLRFWWARLGPKSYARYALTNADAFVVTRPGVFCVRPESDHQAWENIVANPHAESEFASMIGDASPAGKLYALAGLAATNSDSLDAALGWVGADTSHVRILSAFPTADTVAFLSELASGDSARSWARTLTEIARYKCAT